MSELRPNVKEKQEKVEEMKSLIKESEIVGVVNMHGLPANALQNIKDKLYGKAKIRMAKKAVLERALEENDNVSDLKEFLEGQPALILSDMNPFKLYSFIQKNKSPASASPGDELPKDVEVKPGLTDLTPGPAIGTLKQFQLQTKVTQGKLEITKGRKVAEEGEEVTQPMADLFNSLGIKPMKVGMNLVAVVEGDQLFESDVLDVDEEKTLQDLQNAYSRAFNLAFNVEYYTEDNVPIMIQDKFNKARNLAVEVKALDPKFLGDVLAKAKSEADALNSQVGDLPEETKEEETEEDSSDEETEESEDQQDSEDNAQEEQQAEKEE